MTQDLRYQRIPNLITYPAMVLAVAYHFVMNGLDGLLFSGGGLGFGIAILIVPYLMGRMGAGDAKLMGTVGAVVGAKGVFVSFLFIAIVGGVYALIVLLMNRQYSKGFIARNATTAKTFVFTGQFIPISDNAEKKKPKLCYGVAIALGTFIYMFLELSSLMRVI
ncbi:MAG: prepilin peptidase [Desulfobacteraceae bacterium]|nr:MAG: prepilin peptidase [Desulfobacteraceae bacterium]